MEMGGYRECAISAEKHLARKLKMMMDQGRLVGSSFEEVGLDEQPAQ